jgi:hypothetical protein
MFADKLNDLKITLEVLDWLKGKSTRKSSKAVKLSLYLSAMQ